ncbi:hypothetical protein BKA67DRAFT_534187 [Truncatella angustata]|uniref:Uncharacterized protein n=1 Tax=Truncatella angustata TaxID=152316 RepID=A0A9P8ZZN1_9PEZI|nr:uncharacterized protein BKA67DRAFT_534187 [Truncatella angustata]KAH6655255.1 hypothetical protein BKA67DRAFT_534187 [Truncatella angustata]
MPDTSTGSVINGIDQYLYVGNILRKSPLDRNIQLPQQPSHSLQNSAWAPICRSPQARATDPLCYRNCPAANARLLQQPRPKCQPRYRTSWEASTRPVGAVPAAIPSHNSISFRRDGPFTGPSTTSFAGSHAGINQRISADN